MAEPLSFHPKIKVSDLDISSLPLSNFHLVVVVEPDAESWIIREADGDKVTRLLEMLSELIIEDFVGNLDPEIITVPIAQDVKDTLVIIASESMGTDEFYFMPVSEYSDYIVSKDDYEFNRLRILLNGIAINHPDWTRVAVIGGMFGDEIVRAANTVQAAGFATTVVTRYCISENIVVNLDDLFASVTDAHRRIMDNLLDNLFDDLDE